MQFLEQNNGHITPLILVRLLQRLMEQDNREAKPSKNVLTLIVSQLNSLFEGKDRGAMLTIFDFLTYYNRFAILPVFDYHGQAIVFKLLHLLLNRLD